MGATNEAASNTTTNSSLMRIDFTLELFSGAGTAASLTVTT